MDKSTYFFLLIYIKILYLGIKLNSCWKKNRKQILLFYNKQTLKSIMSIKFQALQSYFLFINSLITTKKP